MESKDRFFYNKIKKICKFTTSHSLIQKVNILKKTLSNYKLGPVVHYSPTNLSISVATVCNFKCSWCSTKDYRALIGPKFLSINKAEELLSKFKKAYSVSFSGSGEPFLNKDLFGMIKLANKRKMQVLLTTNGSLLLRKLHELLDSPLDELEVSLKGCSPSEHKETTGRNEKEFFNIISAVKILRKKRKNNLPRIILSYVCDKFRVYNISKVIKIGEECGVNEIAFYNLIPNQTLRNERDCLFVSDKVITNYLNKLKETKFNIKIRWPKLYDINPTDRFCPYPFINLSIGVDGGVCGCGRAFNPSLENGNAFIDKNVFNNPYFQSIRNIFLNNFFPLPYECTYCEFNNCVK